jgi:hypothetical protein
VLAVCVLLAGFAYFKFGRLGGGLVHRWEMFHYYVGSKYHDELGYKRLYSCALVAEADDGVPIAPRRVTTRPATGCTWTMATPVVSRTRTATKRRPTGSTWTTATTPGPT